MTRHTSDFLRQRSSNLSLRGLTTTNASSPSRLSSFVNPSEFEKKPTMSDAEKAFIVGDLKRHALLTLCDSCYRDIPEHLTNSFVLRLTDDRSSCSSCNVMSSKPEAFTEPFCKFLQENPTVFHAVGYFKDKMIALGYKEVGFLCGYSPRRVMS